MKGSGVRAVADNRIDRARRHLWATTFAIIAALSGAVVYFTTRREVDQLPLLLSGRLRFGLAGLLIVFLIYVLDRERHLRLLASSLTDERIESERLAARLENLTELQRERDTNALLLDGSADAIAVVGSDLRLQRFNDAMARLTGVAAGQAEGGFAPAILRFVAEDGTHLAAEDHPIRVALFRGRPVHADLRLTVAGGAERWVSATFSPIRDGGGDTPALLLAILRDVTEAKEMQAMQRDFVSIVSHELRTPLTAIKGFTQTLLQRGETIPPETRAEFLSMVSAQSDRLARLVDDLLQVSKIDARRLRVDLAPQDPVGLVGSIIASFAPKWPRDFSVDVPASLPPVMADRHKLEEVLINLMDNAVKYSPEGAPVGVVARQVDGEVEFSIEDRGAGIGPEDAAKLFQKFQRLSTPATRDVGGTGLGLYIVKGLVEAMGGRVWLESAPGAGSRFAFTIPVAQTASGQGYEAVAG